MKATELFVTCLEAEGVEYVFGLLGGENDDLVMALEDSSIQFILTRHEQGASFMANAYGRHADLSFDNPDFVRLAESFGCRGIRVENARDFKPALEDAFTSDVPCLLVVPIDYRENMLLSGRLGNIACPIWRGENGMKGCFC